MQGAAQWAGQPEHLPVIVKPGDHYHGSCGLQRCDRGVKVVAQCHRVEIRPQRVIHTSHDHRDLGVRRQGARQLPMP
jgi:hypothetical protein